MVNELNELEVVVEVLCILSCRHVGITRYRRFLSDEQPRTAYFCRG